MAELQALLTKSSANIPRRSFNGIDYNRAMLLLAVLEKRGGLRISACDAYLNVIGGLQLDEPAADLAAVLAIASSYTDRPIPDQMAAIGEVGLTGEIRSVSAIEQRLAEVRRLGFDTCIVPRLREKKLKFPDGLQLIQVKNVSEALSAAIGARRRNEEENINSGT